MVMSRPCNLGRAQCFSRKPLPSGRSRWSTGGARSLGGSDLAQSGGGKPVVPRTPGDVRRAGVVHRTSPSVWLAGGEDRAKTLVSRPWGIRGFGGVRRYHRREWPAWGGAPGCAFSCLHALTLGCAPDKVTRPPGRPLTVSRRPKETFRQLQYVWNSPLGHPAPTPAGSVCARSLLENEIVRAKSQCGQSSLFRFAGKGKG